MKNKRYAEITPDCVNVFTRKTSGWNIVSSPLPLAGSLAKSTPSVLLANTSQAAIRVADVPSQEKLMLGPNVNIKEIWQFNKAKIANFMKKASDQWEMITTVYPIGAKLNENTHVFDGTMFTNRDGVSRFYMTALSFDAADEIAKTGIAMFGKAFRLKRIDTVEHLIFRHYAGQGSDAMWVVFPQGDGFRILLLTDGLPKAAWHVSNEPRFREGEILRCLHGSKNLHLLKPIERKPSLSLISDGRMFVALPEMQKQIHEETALNRAVILNTNLDLQWMYDLLAGHGVEVEKGEYRLENYLP